MSFDIDPRDIILGKELGSGSFGKVYSGTVYGSEVAIKVPKRQDIDDDDLAALVEEVEIWRTCSHPHIVQLLGACMRKGDFRIVTEKLDGDLESLIHDTDKPLGLFTRMRMARDIALGMNWLHNTKPAIIHRDLKLGNVLYRKRGAWYEIKVCDFGLAQLKPRHVHHLRDSKKGAVGTPLYMAPEVMLGRPFNEKADVYAFGVCLWEILMREDPYQDYKHYDEFVHAVAEVGARPEIPKDTPSKLKKVMQACWHHDPAKRPNFGEVAEKMLGVIIQCAIEDKAGRKFWSKNFLSQYQVSWEPFVNAFYDFIGYSNLRSRSSSGSIFRLLNSLHLKATGRSFASLSSSQRSGGLEKKKSGSMTNSLSGVEELSDPLTDDDVNVIVSYRCLKAVTAQQEGDDSHVEINWFGDMLKWFGPLQRDDSILDTIRAMLRYPWFHGTIDSDEAKRRLSNMPVGTFLVRFSLTTPGSYTISRVFKPGKVLHSRMQFVPGKGFTLESKKFFPNLSLLLSSLRDPLALKAACGGSQYSDIFKVVISGANPSGETEEGEDEESYKEFSSTVLRHIDKGNGNAKEKEVQNKVKEKKKGKKDKQQSSEKEKKKKKKPQTQ